MAQTRLTLPLLLILLFPQVTPAQERLEPAAAQRFARLALACIDREWPNKPEHTLDGPEDIRSPRFYHPAFFGCYDWHSSVHGHWMLVRLLRSRPDLEGAPEIRARLSAHFTAVAMAAEAKYLDRASARSFERTYGWAWLLRLAAELESWDDSDGRRWRERIRVLEDAVARRLTDFLPKLTNPIRTGVHPNTAFALGETLDYARRMGRKELEALLVSRSRDYYGGDRACPLSYEPSGEDFFSPCLEEADLMRRVLPADEFGRWLGDFLPGLAAGKPLPFVPAVVADPTDPKLVHLDGLNLTRAWTLRGIAGALSASDPRRSILLASSEAHAKAGLARVSSGNYEGEHWLASFAVYLLTGPDPAHASRR
ncbi:MAG TPA: DUF2891 domain-containing protein [Thermoanaerobaculia bacterium]|nr:DUF2891 domain-containing protein [Thermoanaerobaculia bacterium]